MKYENYSKNCILLNYFYLKDLSFRFTYLKETEVFWCLFSVYTTFIAFELKQIIK